MLMSKVVVTGANGFVGAWLVRGLIAQGHEVHALVRKSSDLSELENASCEYVYGDVTDLPSLNAAFQGAEAVFHLAGLIAYRKAEREKMQRINVGGTANVISSCLVNKILRLVYMSSVVAVGAGFSEKDILNEDSPYNVSQLNLGYFETKHEAELLVKKAVRENGLNAVILNPSTIYGGGDARKGSRKTQLKVAQGNFPFYTSGGVNVVNVEAVVDGLISAWKNGRTGERYILAGDNLTIKKLFQMIAKSAGSEPPKIKMPNFLLHSIGAVGDVMDSVGLKGPISRENAWTSTLYHWFDSSKAKQELGFNPAPASVAIENSVRWSREHGLLGDRKQ
jgi:dihydroflavonol-4-reductase